MLWIFLDYSVHLLFKALCLLSCQLSYNGSFPHVVGKPSSVVIVFPWGSCSYHLLCGRFTAEPFSNASVRYHRSFTSQGQILYQFLSFNIPTPCGNYKFIFQPWQGQTWGFWGFFLLTASDRELPYCFPGFYSPFHCGDISARVLVSFCSSSFLWPSATLPVTSWVFKPQSLA